MRRALKRGAIEIGRLLIWLALVLIWVRDGRRPRPPEERSMTEERDQAMDQGGHCDGYTDSDQIGPLPEVEQQAALDRVRRQYHAGGQKLTVAKARYELLKRGVVDGGR